MKPLLTLVLLCLVLAGTLAAQESDPAQSPLAAKARGHLETVQSMIEDARKVEQELGESQGEQLILMQRRMAELRMEVLAELHGLADGVLAMEEAGQDASDLRPEAESFLGLASERIRELIDQLEESLSTGEAAEAVPTTDSETPEEHADKTHAMLDRLYRALLDNKAEMAALGMSTSVDEAFATEHLTQRAEALEARVGLTLEELEALGPELKADPANVDLLAQKRGLDGKLDKSVESLTATIAMMGELGLETTELKRFLIEATGDFSTGLLNKDVLLGLLRDWAAGLRDWIFANSGPALVKLLLFLLILFVFRFLARTTRRVVEKSLDRSKLRLSQLLRNMVISTVSSAVMVLGVLIALSQIGISLAPLLAGLGVAGFIVGFALQDTLGNFASGMMILIYRPYDVGDVIEAAGGVFGTVEKMSLVSTTFLTFDNQTLVVPNSKIWGDVIKNVTAQRLRRVDMKFGIGYEDDVEQAERALQEIVVGHEKVLEEPAPIIKLHELGDSSVDFVVRPWVRTSDYWDVYWDVTRAVKMRFDQEGISIPFPQRDVHVYGALPPAGTEARTASERPPGGRGSSEPAPPSEGVEEAVDAD